MQRTRAKRADAQLAAVAQRAAHPAVEVVDTDRALGHLADVAARENERHGHVALCEHRGGIVRRDEPGFVRLADPPIGLEVERSTEGVEDIQYLGERDRVQVAEVHRTAERQMPGPAMWVGSEERTTAATPRELNPIILDHLAAQEERHPERAHPSKPERNLTASSFTCCVAEQLIRSSSTPCFSLYRTMSCPMATLVRPQAHDLSQSTVISSPEITPPQCAPTKRS
jgi:hypothetical protein